MQLAPSHPLGTDAPIRTYERVFRSERELSVAHTLRDYRALFDVGDFVRQQSLGLFEARGRKSLPHRGLSGSADARRFQGRGPPQQVIDHRAGGCFELGQSGVDVATGVVSPQSGDGDQN
jgi:hypothetical protein